MIVVLGASGQLGTAFRRVLGDQATYLARDELDLSEVESVRPVIEGLRPTTIVNCAAYTAVDRAEEEEELARKVNALAVESLARVAAELGAKLVTYSTDYVFDGRNETGYTEASPARPLNAYGRTKREGEERALEANPSALVIRASWLFSGTHPNFVATMLRLAAEGGAKVVEDQWGHPTYVDHLAAASLRALDAGATGLLHLANQGVTTWYGLAREATEIGGLAPGRIVPCTTAEFPRQAPRPRFSILESERLEELGLQPLPHYRVGLQEAVLRLTESMPTARSPGLRIGFPGDD